MPLKIYYLDDEAALCEIFFDIVSSSRYHVETFQDVELFLKRYENAKPDLIFLDYRLHNTTGDKVAEKLDASIPKVLISGDLQLNTKFKFDVFLPKPFKEAQLLDLIEKLTHSSKA